MPAKSDSAYRQQHDSRRQDYLHARSLRQAFPRVDELVVEASFHDPHGFSRPSPQMHSFLPAAKAYFVIACPCSLCVEGGFDLTSAIRRMLSAEQAQTSGALECNGWRDPRRKDRCRLQLSYKISARYQSGEA